MVENLFVCNALVNLYAKCLRVREAQAVFDLMPHEEVVSSNGVLTTYFTNSDVVSWTSLSSCYVECGFPQKGLNVFREMVWNGVKPDSVTVSSILPACSNLQDLKSGKEIHGFAVRHGMVENLSVCNALVNLYAKCLCVREAQTIFDLMPH
jgi:pentatricopeptide repeat protein